MARGSRRGSLLGIPVLVAGALWSTPARAEADVFTGALVAVAEALTELNFYSQLQAGLFAVSNDDFRPGGAGVRAGFNALGFGGSIGARMEKFPGGVGGLVLADFEFRPLPYLKNNFYRVIDPFACAGVELGGGSLGFHAAQTIGAGVDIGLFGRPDSNRSVLQPVLTVRYQFRPFQLPADLPQHLLMIGAATRIVF